MSKLLNKCPNTPVDYQTALQISLQIGTQIKILADRGLCVPVVTPDKILLAKEGKYLLDPSTYIKLETGRKYELKSPSQEPDAYLSPELKDQGVGTFSYTTSLYSFAISILTLIDSDLESLEPTKLFYLLKRCLHDNPSARLFLYV